MTDSPKEKKFMRETIVKQEKPKGRLIVKVFGLCLFAILFGVISAVSFVLALPAAKEYLAPETTEPSIPITIEKDDEPTSAALMETMETTIAESEPEPTESAIADEDDIREIVQDELNSWQFWTEEKMAEFNSLLTKVGRDTDDSIVTISSTKHQVDWFDNPVESTGQYAGVILVENYGEILILTGMEAVEEADTLSVIFHDGKQAEAEVKQRDTIAGMAVVSVKGANVEKSTRDRIEPIQLGNSYSVNAGDMVIAVGSPAGRVHSMQHGAVTYIAKGVQTADGQTRVLYTDMDCNKEKGTFFLNLSGQLIGWATTSLGTEETAGITFAASISEYKGHLQKLSNGIEIPYLGIMGQEVTALMTEENIPQGIYITESMVDGPAYLAGIQSGDILTGIQEDTIVTMRDYQSYLEGLKSGQEVTLTIERKGIDTYKEIQYQVIIGAR